MFFEADVGISFSAYWFFISRVLFGNASSRSRIIIDTNLMDYTNVLMIVISNIYTYVHNWARFSSKGPYPDPLRVRNLKRFRLVAFSDMLLVLLFFFIFLASYHLQNLQTNFTSFYSHVELLLGIKPGPSTTGSPTLTLIIVVYYIYLLIVFRQLFIVQQLTK